MIATKWRELIYSWESNEWLLLQEIDENYSPKQLKRKASLVMLASFGIGCILHCLWQVTVYNDTTECDGFNSQTHAFFSNSFPGFFSIVPYTFPIAICAWIIAFVCEISKIHLNVFLTIVCLGLKEQFAILNRRVIGTPLKVS